MSDLQEPSETYPLTTMVLPSELELPFLKKMQAEIDSLKAAGVTRYLNRGHVKMTLMMYLAEEFHTHEQLASIFKVERSRIAQFARVNQSQIEELRKEILADVKEQLTHLWVARKDYRLGEYQQSIEDIEEWILRSIMYGRVPDTQLLKTKFAALHAVAEELGDLPTRVAITQNTTTVNYSLEGVDIDNLR